ncbi:MAG: hypothetical protein WHV61_09945 [Burkholderiales bacterium]
MNGLRRLGPLLALLLLTAAVYWPGLKGPFLFDDFGNLRLLEEAGRLDRPENVIRYLLSGFAGPTGRPVAMASFIPQAAHWPNDPAPFKRTNLLLHLLNGVLLAAVSRRLLRQQGLPAARADATAWLAAAIWLLHPLWVSTTLYVVQRMTLLATMFVLLGLLLYLAGRERLLEGQRGGFPLVLLGLYGMGLLATLSKENGALLPLLVLVMERYGLAIRPLPPPARRRVLVAAGLPALAVLAYLAAFLPALFRGEAGIRDFTPAERLLTEGRVLWSYLAALFLPSPEPGGLYGQDVAVSRGLFDPWTTGIAWLAVAALWSLGERLRRHWPAAAFAIMFFLAGHLLESTWVPLELAFEHRNYLPAAFLFLPVAQALAALPRPFWQRAAVLGVIGVMAGLTLLRADLWGRPFAQALTWARQHSESPRAQAHLAALWLTTGNREEAARVLDAALRTHPRDLLLNLNRLLAACPDAVAAPLVEQAVDAIGHAHLGHRVVQYQITRLLAELREGHCGAVSRSLFETLWKAADRAADAPFRAILLQERALLHLAEKRPTAAAQDFAEALRLDPRPDAQLASAAALARHDAFREALSLLDMPLDRPAPAGRPWEIDAWREHWLERHGYWQRERALLRATIEADLAAALPESRESANVGAP